MSDEDLSSSTVFSLHNFAKFVDAIASDSSNLIKIKKIKKRLIN